MKQKLTDTNYTVSRGGRVEDYWMTRVMHPHYAQEEAKQQEVDMVAILKEYKLKGFEFGNWVNQNDRYDFIHAFTRSAQILSEIIGSKNIGLDLLVGVAFGARGRGGGAVAHYEPMHNMINLTKEKSYGSLAHEWGHAIDYNLGRYIDQNKDYSFLTGGHSVAAILPKNTGAQLRMWANAVVDEAKATPSYKRIEKADEYWHRRAEVWARFMEQYVAYQCKLKKKSPRYLALTFEEYTKMTAYWTEADFVKIARGSMFSFMAVLKGVLNNRYNLTASPYKYKTRDMLYPKPGKAPKPKYTLPLYVVLKGRKPTDSNMLKFDKTEIKDGKVYYIGRSVDAAPKEAYRHTPEEKILADYDRVHRLTAEKAIREKWNSGTHQEAAKRAASKPATKKPELDFDISILKRYDELKKQYPSTVLLFRSDDFYECWKEDAVEVAKILNITLVHKGGRNGIPAAGFPYKMLDTYLPKLVRAGKRVAIVDKLDKSNQRESKAFRVGETVLYNSQKAVITGISQAADSVALKVGRKKVYAYLTEIKKIPANKTQSRKK